MSDSLLPHKLHHIWLPCPVLYPQVCSTNHLILSHHPRSQWCCPISLSSALLLLLSIFPSIKVFSNELDFHIKWPKYWSFSFSISSSNDIQGWFPLGLTGLISLLSKGLSESSPTSKFKSINSSVLNLLHSPTLTSIHVSRGCSESTSLHASSSQTYSEEHWGARERIMQRRSKELKWIEQNPFLLGERISDYWSSGLLGPNISLSI